MTEADSGWLLRHRDGVEHGPFRFADLISAAESGNIADDTNVLHKNHTQGKWVIASRVQPIAAAMASPSVNPAAAKPAPTKPAAPAPTKPAAPAPTKPAAPAKPAPAAGTPGMAPTSAFRRPATQQTSATPANIPQRPNQATDQASADEPSAGLLSEPELAHAVRTRHHSFPVPKHSHEAALAFFDFRFRYFVTPWIIKILWSITVTVTLLWLAVMTYSLWIQPSVDAPGPRTVDGPNRWEFTPLANQSFFQSDFFAFALLCGITLLLVLLARVALEFLIVFFRIATDIAELKRTFLKE